MSKKLNRQNIYSGLSLERPKASFVKRLIAYCIDLSMISVFSFALFLLLISVSILIYMSIDYLNIESTEIFNSIVLSLIYSSIFIGILLILFAHSAYFIYFETRKRGSTPGKSVMGLRVIAIDASNITFAQSLFREMMRIVDGGLILPGLISIYLSDKNQRLGDLASNTMVIYLKKNEKMNEFLFITQEQYFKLHEKIKPEMPDEDITKRYLAFSMNYFIRGKTNLAEYNEWLPIARSHYRSELAEKIDKITTLKFFSELCNQTKHSPKRETIKNLKEKDYYPERENNETEESILNLASKPEAIFRPAGFSIRFWAALIDVIFVGVLLYPLNFVYQMSLIYMTESEYDSTIFAHILSRLIYAVIFGIIAALFITKKGGLPGKLLIGLKIVDYETGSFISGLRAFVREVFAKTISLLLFGAGFLMIGISREKRGLHDHLCRTMVVEKNKHYTKQIKT